VPFLWFDQETEEAVNFYVSIFNGSPHKVRDSGIISITRYEKGMEVPGGDQQVWPRQVCMIFRVASICLNLTQSIPKFTLGIYTQLYPNSSFLDYQIDDVSKRDWIPTRLFQGKVNIKGLVVTTGQNIKSL
jgi:hypothetical protein